MEAINYEMEVKKACPDAYVCQNTLFETVCIYEDFTFSNRLSERVKSVWEAWQSAYNNLVEQGKIKVNAKQSESL